MKAIRWKHIACALGISVHKPHLKSEIWCNTFWIHEKAPCTEVRNWLWVIMHKHQMPWHFMSLPNNHLPLLCLFAINDWISDSQQSHFCCVYVSPIHTAATSTHGSMHSKAYLQPLDGGPMETVLIISLLLQSTAVCFGIRGFLWRLHMHTHWLQAREGEGERQRERERREFFYSINPPLPRSLLVCPAHPSPSSSSVLPSSLPMPDTLASPRSITSPWCNV